MTRELKRALLATLLLAAAPAHSSEVLEDLVKKEPPAPTREEQIAWKLTPTYYRTSSQPSAWDLNLRGSLGAHNAWVGYYRQEEIFSQGRVGWDYTADAPFGRIVPSLQYATRGFWGGSLNAEVGDRWFGIAGWGRTNLRDYFNLNFDPNDAVTFGLGTRAVPKTLLSLYQVRDDRLDTGQRITHFATRLRPDAKQRWIFDVFYKEGRPDSDPASPELRGTGLSVTYDYGNYFARVASDPHVNFTENHMTRVSLGLRF